MIMNKKSHWFERFVASVLEPMTWSNIAEYSGVGALRLLEGEERAEAEDLLFERLTHNDGRAAYALAEIGSARAIEPLRACLAATVPGGMRVAAAMALQQLGDDSGRDAAIDVLRSGTALDQQSAMSVLALLGGEGVEAALERALAANDASVRGDAARTMISLHHLGAYKGGYQQRLGLLQNRCSSPLATVRADALAELREIFARHERGESPEQLGLTWRADDERPPLLAFSESLRGREPPWQRDFAVEVVEQLAGTERTWAEDCLWHFLPTDPRAARAIARLGVVRAIPALRELLPTATGVVAVEVAAALWRLAADPVAREHLETATRGADPDLVARASAALA
jgi:HEAT repeat protein